MKRALLTGLLTVALLAAAVVIPAARQNLQPHAVTPTAIVLDEQNWDEFAPRGKEVDAIYGDIVLRNNHLVAVIAQPLPTRNANMTVREVGGALIDFTTRQHSADQLSAFYPGKRNYKYNKGSFSGIDFSGSKFQRELSADDKVISGRSVSFTAEAAATDGKPGVTTVYRLAENQSYLEVETTYANPHTDAITVELEDDLRLDAGKEDMQKAPNGKAKSFWAYDRHWGQAYALTDVEGKDMPGDILMNSDARLSSLNYETSAGQTFVTLPAGESFTITRRLWVNFDLVQLRTAQARHEQRALMRVVVELKDGVDQPLGPALVELTDADGVFYASARARHDGYFDVFLPEGQYQARVTYQGRRLDDGDLKLTAVTNQPPAETPKVAFKDYLTGTVEVRVLEGHGDIDAHIPCKVEFRPLDGKPLDFGPETAEFGVKNLRYTPNGLFTQQLPAGEYDISISHGPEYELVQRKLVIEPGKTATLEARLHRTVDTAGWVSSDFHSHSSPSGDNTGSQLGRVLNLVAEHIEFAPCTEHNRVDTYVPHIERLGVKDFIATVSGMELTGQPLPLNHQNAFPLRRTPHTQDNGGPLVADNLEEQIERLALWDDRSDKLVQVNHPDIGWMFYDKNGDGVPDNGFERAFPFIDVMEIHPVDNALQLEPVREFPGGNKYHNNVFRWLQLLNQGFRIYGVVNTDAHYNYHGSGGLRNWIQSSTDDPAKIDPMEMVHAAQEGRLVMSNGPFLEVWASEPGQAKKVTCGQDLAAPGKQVSLKVKVQTPSWLDINRVFVLVNGRIDPKHDYSREKTPDLFRSGVLKFDETLEVALTQDAHIIVVAGHAGGRFPAAVMPGPWQPAALTNPVFVDVDGDGFQANKDTLDHPLPVKFAAAK